MTCRVCGKEYEPCRTANRRPNVFHWQEVACSPECGAIYLQRITESRQPAGAHKKSKRKKETVFTEEAPVVDVPSLATVGAEPFTPSESTPDTNAEVE